MLKKIQKALLRAAWYLGGQKTQPGGAVRVPPLGYVAPSAVVPFPDRVELGEGVLLQPGAQLLCTGMPPYLQGSGRIVIGKESIVRENAFLQTYGGSIVIGADCTINPFCVLQGNGGITIGDSVLIAAHVQIFSANHVFDKPDARIRTQGERAAAVTIGNDVWLGAGAIILAGVTIGDGAVVAAGSVVNADVPPFTVAAGVPARVVKQRRAGEKVQA